MRSARKPLACGLRNRAIEVFLDAQAEICAEATRIVDPIAIEPAFESPLPALEVELHLFEGLARFFCWRKQLGSTMIGVVEGADPTFFDHEVDGSLYALTRHIQSACDLGDREALCHEEIEDSQPPYRDTVCGRSAFVGSTQALIEAPVLVEEVVDHVDRMLSK